MKFPGNFRRGFPSMSPSFYDKPSSMSSLLQNFRHLSHLPCSVSDFSHLYCVNPAIGGPSRALFSAFPATQTTGLLKSYLNGFHTDFIAPPSNTPSSLNMLHGFQGYPPGGFFDYSANMPGPPLRQAKLYQPANYQEGSCISTAQSGYQRKVDLKKKRVQMRKTSKSTKPVTIIKGQWSPEEDRMLVQLVERYGTKRWSVVANVFQGRVGKQCRERWHNHLRPDIKKDSWSEEEDKILILAHMKIGNRWAEMERYLPGRTENAIKNRWNATKRRKNSKKIEKLDPDSSRSSSLLKNYIHSVMASSPSSSKNAVEETLFESKPQIMRKVIEPAAKYPMDRIKSEVDNSADFPMIFEGEASGFPVKGNILSESYGFVVNGSAAEENNFIQCEMPLEMDKLMHSEVKPELDLMDMIYQGKLYQGLCTA